jgi:hypothetical protein
VLVVAEVFNTRTDHEALRIVFVTGISSECAGH